MSYNPKQVLLSGLNSDAQSQINSKALKQTFRFTTTSVNVDSSTICSFNPDKSKYYLFNVNSNLPNYLGSTGYGWYTYMEGTGVQIYLEVYDDVTLIKSIPTMNGMFNNIFVLQLSYGSTINIQLNRNGQPDRGSHADDIFTLDIREL